MEKHEKTQNNFKEICSLLIPNSDSVKAVAGFIALLTVLGSIVTLVVSSCTAEDFSEYYGIQKSNLDVLTTAKDMIVIFGPVLIAALFVFYSIMLIYNRKDDYSSYRERYEKVMSLVMIPSSIVLLFCMLLTGRGLFSSRKAEVLFFVIGLILLTVFLSYILIRKKDSGYPGIRMLFFFLLGLYFCFIIFIFAVQRFIKEFDPKYITAYEITSVDNKDYAVVYTSGDRKLIMSCDISYEDEKMTLHYGKYRLIQAEDCEYDYHMFHSVIRDIDL